MQDGYVIDSGTRMNALNVGELTMICFTAEGVFGLLFRGGGVSLTVLTMYPSRCSVSTTGCGGDTVIGDLCSLGENSQFNSGGRTGHSFKLNVVLTKVSVYK